ncbi:MAG: hypothetical protein B6244_04120 [Candidatus Cloacimonetes bacterium 4572_55]|nr:MAG: hypothetical protein B6244_04120 [Candidatus Cloacimonetes bacterium 4572_55]
MPNTKILIVEDERIIARDLKFRLEKLGYEVAGMVTTGEGAIDLTPKIQPDLILMDIGLPGNMDGVETAEVICLQTNVPVIYITAYSDPDTLKRVKKTSPYGYLLKPFKYKSLEIIVEMALYKYQMGKKLRESEKRYRELFDNMSSGVAVYEVIGDAEDFIFRDFNKAGERIDNQSREELIGRSIFETRPSVEKFGLIDVFRRVWRTGKSERYPVNLYKDEERVGWYENFIYKLPTGEIVAVFDNVTEEKRMAEELATERERLSVTLRCIADGVIATDVNGKVVMLNRVAEELTGWTQSEAWGGKITDVFHIVDEQTRLPIENPVPSILKNGVVGMVDRIMLVSKEGRTHPISSRGALIYDSSQQVIGVALVFREMTESRRLEQAKENFINAISHELRTPLTPILGYAEMMLSTELEREQQKIFLHQIINSVQRERELVDELLAVARLESDKEQYQFMEINVYSLFQNMATNNHMLVQKIVEERYETDNYQFDYELDLSLKNVIVNVDSRRIQQVVENLLSNAVKFSFPDRLKITLTVGLTPDNEQGDCLIVKVRDKGEGIPTSEQGNIFKPFYQIRRRAYDVSDGIGQGLSITKRYVEAHGGEIGVESAVGDGSCFFFTLPIVAHSKPPKKKKLALVIEDDKENGNFITLLLENIGFQVLYLFDGRSAIDAIRKRKVDSVILDIQLPDMTGEKILDEVTQSSPDTRVILCSAQPQEKMKAIAECYHVVKGYLSKPFNITELIEAIKT